MGELRTHSVDQNLNHTQGNYLRGIQMCDGSGASAGVHGSHHGWLAFVWPYLCFGACGEWVWEQHFHGFYISIGTALVRNHRHWIWVNWGNLQGVLMWVVKGGKKNTAKLVFFTSTVVGIYVLNFGPEWKERSQYIFQLAGEESQIVPIGGIILLLRDRELIRRCQIEPAL